MAMRALALETTEAGTAADAPRYVPLLSQLACARSRLGLDPIEMLQRARALAFAPVSGEALRSLGDAELMCGNDGQRR